MLNMDIYMSSPKLRSFVHLDYIQLEFFFPLSFTFVLYIIMQDTFSVEIDHERIFINRETYEIDEHVFLMSGKSASTPSKIYNTPATTAALDNISYLESIAYSSVGRLFGLMVYKLV